MAGALFQRAQAYRGLHIRLMMLWVIVLTAEALVSILLIYAIALSAVVIVTSTIGPVDRLTLITITQRLTSRYERRIRSSLA